jgi:hypothetical protein
MTAAQKEALDLLVQLRAVLVGVHRALRQMPGANKAHDRILAGMFDDASALEREVANVTGA